MRIAIITNNRPHAGGINTYIENVVNGLKELGCQVDIITPFGISNKFKIIKSWVFNRTDTLLKNHGLATLLLIKVTQLLIFIWTLIANLKNKYDFLYPINVTVANAIRPLEKTMKLNIILNPISTVHGELVAQGKVKKNSWVAKRILKQEKKAYSKAKAIIAVAKHLAQYFDRISPKHAKISIVACPYDDKNFFYDEKARVTARKKLGLENKFVILFIARMVIEKGPLEALEAFKQVVKAENDVTLLFVGSGSLKEEITTLVKKNNLEEKVKILGFIPDDEVPKIYNAADVLITPTFTYKKLRQEGQGTTPQEAMACKVPVIASACGGLTDTIQHEKNGLLVQEKNIEDLAKAILRIKNDDQLRQNIVKQGYIDVQNRYKPKIIAQEIIDVYKETFKN